MESDDNNNKGQGNDGNSRPIEPPKGLNRLVNGVLLAAAGMVGFIVLYEGFRTDGFTVEHPFRYNGKNMAVLKDRRFILPTCWVQEFDESIKLDKGTDIGWVNPQYARPKIYNFDGKSDSGEMISVGMLDYMIVKTK